MATHKKTERLERLSGDIELLRPFIDEYAAKTHELIQSIGIKLESKFDALARELQEKIQCIKGDMK